ncbi:four helix bundle protein [Bacteroides sp. 519]|uniref:four helix bundle protein n=1 Tax=Bacteroides sp. 519 TaxID=2302937 RepID=UPI0013D09E4B|nr:four helix bundle protein [Bacteroides sp. 519]NDV58217.1 four helix bundle protein [Bacteroides sp. 519]
MKENIIATKTYKFALRIVNAYLFLSKEKQEYVLSKQLLRSGTAIGALVSESRFAQSKADFINKLHIAIKEANETRYWINLLHDADFITEAMYLSIFPEIEEIISILSSIIKTSKKN